MTGWPELWAVQRMGNEASARISPNGDEIAIGITNTIALTGVSNRVSLADARALAFALLEVTGGMPGTAPAVANGLVGGCNG